jgi:hypothetical protein
MRQSRPFASRAVWFVLVSALSTAASAQPRPPSDAELRAMYCVSVVRAEIGLQHRMISASDEAAGGAATPELRQQWIDTSSELLQGLARLEVVLYRLQFFMLPRIHELDAFALASAIRQGDSDFEESRAVADRCAAQCNAASGELQVCIASCSNNALLSRVSACDNPSWLPP